MQKIKNVCFSLVLMLIFMSHAQSAQLLAIEQNKIMSQEVGIKLVFSRLTKYKAFLLNKPRRLVIDFTDMELVDNQLKKLGQFPYITGIRHANRNANDLRIVFDFEQGVKVKKYTLTRDSQNSSILQLGILIDKAIKTEGSIAEVIEQKNMGRVESHISSKNVDKSQKTQQQESVFWKNMLSGWELSGEVSIEELGFFHEKLDSRQHNNYISGAFEAEIYREWDNGRQSFTFVPFFRYSQHDNKRTHFDIRELTWLLAENEWELRVGIREVFWGVTEGLHLVNIINQTDLVENTDTEDKLGQPMINLALIRDWGTVDLFILPGFRERTFSGVEGRFRSIPEVSVGHAVYEKSGIEKHLAYAARWSHVIGDWDLGLSHFYGTSRDPVFNPEITSSGKFRLIPYYQLINQTGLDVQLTYDDWIFKHEGIVRSGQGKTFYAMTTGIEYTLFDFYRTGLDLGFVVEYMYDTRGANNFLAPFQDDILTALRFGFNDVQSTEILAGILFDRTGNSKFYNIEASRRLGDDFKLEMEVRIYSGASSRDPTYMLREDDHIRLDLSYHF